MTRQAISEIYPTAPDGFSLLREYDPETGLNHFRVKFVATLEQTITDEMMGYINLATEEIWGTVIRELESSLGRRFS